MQTEKKVAVLGLGLIGSAWANNLSDDKVLAATWNRSKRDTAPNFHGSLQEVADLADILHIVVSDEHAVIQLVKDLKPFLSASKTIIQSSTIDPKSSEIAKNIVMETGARYIEAPFTGSLLAAEQRKTVFFLGGERKLISELTSYFSRLSQLQYTIGTNKQACTVKLAMNLQIASAIKALSQALEITRNADISDELFFEVFEKNASYSGVAAMKAPKILTNDFSPQFSVKHMAKDLRLIAENLGGDMELVRVLRGALKKAEDQGMGELDFSVIAGRRE